MEPASTSASQSVNGPSRLSFPMSPPSPVRCAIGKSSTWGADPDTRSPELGNLLGPFEDSASIVFQWSPSGFAVVHDAWVRPIRDADAAVAALLVTHDVAPLAVDIAMTV